MQLTGTLDPLYGLTNLQDLTVGATSVRGGVESGIRRLTALTALNLYGMLNLNGTVASEIGLLTNLEILSASYSGLASTLPTQIGLLTKLASLELAECNFVGSIPTEFKNLHKLTHLDLSFSEFVGTKTCFLLICNFKNVEFRRHCS